MEKTFQYLIVGTAPPYENQYAVMIIVGAWSLAAFKAAGDTPRFHDR